MALIVGASVFGGPGDPGTGSTGYRGDNLYKRPDSFAELGQGGAIGNALGKLPYGAALRVTNVANGRSMVLYKRDVGSGGGPVSGKHRSVDLWFQAAQRLGVNGLGLVKIERVNGQQLRQQQGGTNVPSPTLPGVPAPGHLQTQTQFDQPGFDQAVKSFRVGSFLAGQGQAKNNPLFLSGLLSTTAPSTQDFTQSFQRFVPGAAGRPTAVRGQPTGGGGWVHPIAGMQPGWQGRIDNGVDYETRPGTALRAVGSGKVVNLNGAFPGGSIVIKLDRPFNGHQYVYYGHLNGNKLVRVGQRVNAGQTVARSSANPSGANTPGHVEIGFARGPEGVIFLGGHAPGPTPWGQAFNTLATKYARR